jgi:branched-chain amino acid transport system permease protein
MSKSRYFGVAAGVLALALLPLLGLGGYINHLLVLWMLFALMAISLNLIIGYLGELSFGHAAFFGIGAYTSAMLSVYLQVPFWIGLLAAPLVAGAFGLVIGFVSLRVKGPQFAILTLGFGAILHSVVINWMEVTNGPLGITKIPRPQVPFLPSIDLGLAANYYYIALAAVLAAVYICRALMSSRTGRAFLAVRENDVLAAAVGIDVFRFKLLAFVLATMMVGVAGSLYAHYMGVITPDLLTLAYMAPMIIMVIVGGKGTINGPIIGALLYVGLLEVLRSSGSMRMLVFAILLTICVIVLPGGIVSLWSRVRPMKPQPAGGVRDGAA